MDKSIILRGDAHIMSDNCALPLDASVIVNEEAQVGHVLSPRGQRLLRWIPK